MIFNQQRAEMMRFWRQLLILRRQHLGTDVTRNTWHDSDFLLKHSQAQPASSSTQITHNVVIWDLATGKSDLHSGTWRRQNRSFCSVYHLKGNRFTLHYSHAHSPHYKPIYKHNYCFELIMTLSNHSIMQTWLDSSHLPTINDWGVQIERHLFQKSSSTIKLTPIRRTEAVLFWYTRVTVKARHQCVLKIADIINNEQQIDIDKYKL